MKYFLAVPPERKGHARLNTLFGPQRDRKRIPQHVLHLALDPGKVRGYRRRHFIERGILSHTKGLVSRGRKRDQRQRKQQQNDDFSHTAYDLFSHPLFRCSSFRYSRYSIFTLIS